MEQQNNGNERISQAKALTRLEVLVDQQTRSIERLEVMVDKLNSTTALEMTDDDVHAIKDLVSHKRNAHESILMTQRTVIGTLTGYGALGVLAYILGHFVK